MGRPLRIQYPGAIYHVYTRGVDGRPIFRTRKHRQFLLRLLLRTVRLDAVRIHAYCLMTNHLHLLLDTPRANVAASMHRLLSHYAREFNAHDARRGHLFENRYGANLVRSEEQFLKAASYVVLNPVRAGICAHPGDYPWSSYRATAGLAPKPPFLTTEVILALFGRDPATARRRYRDFVLTDMERIAA